jgi:Zn-dependent protease
VFVISLFAFVGYQLVRQERLVTAALIIGVLLFHELGHLMTMRAVGYRDVRIFFIPFFGAAASGHKSDASASKEAAVLLMGPLPGLALSVATAVAWWVTREPILRQLTYTLIAVNMFNLLPAVPLDGGRVFSLVLYSRWRWLEVLCGALSALVLIGLGLKFELWVLGALGLVMLLQLPLRTRLLGAAARLRAERSDLSPDPKLADEAATSALYIAVRDIMPVQQKDKPRVLAAWMREMLDATTRKSPKLGGSIAILSLWLLGFVISAVALVVLAIAARH